MAFLSSLVWCSLLCLASDVVELEPVKLPSFGCDSNKYNQSQADCDASPYCRYLGEANTSHTCQDDACLLTTTAGGAESVCSAQKSNTGYDCVHENQSTVVGNDCNGGDGYYCRAVGNNYLKTYAIEYCVYAYVRDGGVCPDSICDNSSGQCRNKANLDSPKGCMALTTKEECGLIPKCYWPSGTCQPDPCYRTKPDGAACSGVEVLVGDKNETGLCIDFKPLVLGEVVDMCVHKDNSKANICYFGTTGSTLTTSLDTNDWGNSGTFPTLNYSSGVSPTPINTPTCTGTIGTGCEGNGECYTVINKKGAFAGLYCTDGTHGAANILRIPSLLVLLGVSVLVAMFTL